MAMTEALQKIGPYAVEKLLASGGMAEIYLAKKRGPGGFEKSLVIKRITKKLLGNPEIEAMFLDEARVQSLLDHPNVVQIYDFGEAGGAYYMAMEFVAGATLRWVIDNALAVKRPIPVGHALRLASDILAGLNHAHQRKDKKGKRLGLIHRDISPVNILVARNGVAKLCDFGVAKSELQSVMTQVGMVKGKFRYMAPEQIQGRRLDHRADIFAVGVVLWEMLTGRRLFNQSREQDAVDAIIGGHFPAASKYRRDVPRPVDRLLRRALAADPRRRFKTARRFQLACEDLLRMMPETSNAALLADYVCAELDGTASLVPDRKRKGGFDHDVSVAMAFEMLDPPVPKHPTRIRAPEPAEDSVVEELPPAPRRVSKLVGGLLVLPLLPFLAVARTLAALVRVFKPSPSEEEVTTIGPR
jgi:serine/threonine-protein kinase